MDWLKRSYDAVGLTQFPVGPHLGALEGRLRGAVVFCLDVSGSMAGARLEQAVEGVLRFLAEARAAGYAVAGVRWHHAVEDWTPLGTDGNVVDALFRGASAGGGTSLAPALERSEQILRGRSGDRVVAVFGDGELGDRGLALAAAAGLREQGIRVLTCGLGERTAQELAEFSTEPATVRVAAQEGIADAIAAMASALRRPGG